MAHRIQICTAGLLLLLSLLQTTQSASITDTVTIQLERLGDDALTYLKTSAASALRNRKGPFTVGCITEPKELDQLDCALISTFSSYLKAALNHTPNHDNGTLREKLRSILQPVESLSKTCSSCSTNICESIFQDKREHKKLDQLRSLLELYLKWIVKPRKLSC